MTLLVSSVLGFPSLFIGEGEGLKEADSVPPDETSERRGMGKFEELEDTLTILGVPVK